jgi:hypothetical protein
MSLKVNMRIPTLAVTMVTLVLVCSLAVNAQSTGQIETRTRLVSQFSGLQNQWLDAIKQRDAAALDRLLSDDFEVWTPDHPAPIPREEWQAQAFAENLKSFKIADMAVKSPRDGVAIESFRLETTMSSNRSTSTQQFFVVNLWINEQDHWLCTDSYVSPVAAAPAVTPVKPSGKD